MTTASTTFEARDHADGEMLGEFPVYRADDVVATLETARAAASTWAQSTLGERGRILRSWRGRLWREATDVATLLHRETGCGLDEAMLDVLQVVEHLKWVEQNLSRVLGSTSRSRTLLTPDLAHRTHYVPDGVVGVVAASALTPLYAVASATVAALAAGNAVVVKAHPEATAIVERWAALFPGQRRALQVITGGEATAEALAEAEAGPDRLVVFGSTPDLAALASIAGSNLVPVVSVPVGPPVVIVAPDADVRAAAGAVARSTDRAAGHADAAPEVYVAPDVSEAFAEELQAALAEKAAHARSLTGGRFARRLLGRSSDRGHRPVALGAGRSAASRPEVHTDAEFADVLAELAERPHAQIVVFSRKRGARVAQALQAAHVSINVGVCAPSLDGGLPREAIGAHGYGPLGGDDGLRQFARAVQTTSKRWLPVPTSPADVLLALPAGRAAARLAMHVRHSLD